MRTFIILAVCLALGSAKPRALSKQALSTPLAWGRRCRSWRIPSSNCPYQGCGRLSDVRWLPCGPQQGGHCWEGMKPNKLGVDVGSHHLNKQDPDQKSIAV